MSKWDKLINKLLSLSKDIRFSELKKILEFYGYRSYQPSKGSSHYIFRKEGKPSITIPKHEPIKICYILMVKKVIMEDDK